MLLQFRTASGDLFLGPASVIPRVGETVVIEGTGYQVTEVAYEYRQGRGLDRDHMKVQPVVSLEPR